jgi:hypothetical protein
MNLGRFFRKETLKRALAVAGFAFLIGLIFLPIAAEAAGIPYWGPLLSCVGNGQHLPSGLPDCKSVCDLLLTGQNILYFAITIALFVLLPLGVAIGGLKIMVSGGNSEGESSGKKILTGVAMALLIILGAYLIVNTIFYFAAKLTDTGSLNTDWSTIQCDVPTSTTTTP